MNDITPEQINLVQSSWGMVAPISGTAAELFYGRLFELDPGLRPLFKSDIKEQGKKLMQMISVAVQGLNNLDGIVPAVQSLGKRHVGYGVKPEHYDTVGVALLWTLEKGLGSEFNEDVKTAWENVYGTLAAVMKDAAYSTA
ncbi:MAG: hemin receptor [bacterium]|nr:hemin receptor [bacterium]